MVQLLPPVFLDLDAEITRQGKDLDEALLDVDGDDRDGVRAMGTLHIVDSNSQYVDVASQLVVLEILFNFPCSGCDKVVEAQGDPQADCYEA
jgi:hypothetical protein